MNLERRKKFIESAFDVLDPIIERLDADEKILYSTKLQALRKRFFDPEFRLAVVGNFNCGKSTFLNALLGKNFLATDLLPKTALATYIRWNKEILLEQNRNDERYCNPIVTLTMTDGKSYTLTRIGKANFERETGITLPNDTGAIIDTLTTTNELADKIQRVDLTFPKRRGFENLCLIDTPGINPGAEENKTHILQTQKVLFEAADAVIVLYPVTQTMARNTDEFLRDNAAHLMAGATIVLTKTDLVSARDVEKIVGYTARMVKERFAQAEPKVYAVSAQQAIDYFSGDDTDETTLRGANHFTEVLTEIITQLGDRRSEIILRRISDLTRELIDSISKTVTANLTSLEEERALLKKASCENLDRDFDKLNAAYKKNLSGKILSIRRTLLDKVHEIVDDKRQEILSRIENAESAKNLKLLLKYYGRNLSNEVEQKVLAQVTAHMTEPLKKFSDAYVENVAACLNEYQRYLGAIVNFTASPDQHSFKVFFASPVPLNDSFSSDSVILAGLTFLANLVDGFFLDSKKKAATEEILESLQEYESELVTTCETYINRIGAENLDWSTALLQKYKAEYQTAFDEIERRHNERVAAVEAQIIDSKQDIDRIESLRSLSAEI